MVESMVETKPLTLPSSTKAQPLCVDLDGTLIKTDLLFESLAVLLKRKPLLLLLVPFWMLRGKAALKSTLARHVTVNIASLPYHVIFLEWLRTQKRAGRQLFLVTASDTSLAHRVADHIGLFDQVLASDGQLNLKGKQKLNVLQKVISGEFEYAGNSTADLSIWRHCQGAIAVGASQSLLRRIRRTIADVVVFEVPERRWMRYAAALRIHQWAKNALVFVPLVTSHQFVQPVLLLKSAICVVLLSLCSSAQYILNDLIDLEADRSHPVKRNRPFAKGELPLVVGFILVPVLFAVSVGAALLLSKAFALSLVIYFGVALSYSLWIKKAVLLDTFVLAGLYAFRIVMGHLVTGVAFSLWLLSFAFFLFLSLALNKRWSELNNLRRRGAPMVTRGYLPTDIDQINVFGVCSAFLSAVIFLLYLQTDTVRSLYQQPQVLWLLSPVFLYWVTRVWILSARGEVSEDPILFVLKDRATVPVVLICGLIMVAATKGWGL